MKAFKLYFSMICLLSVFTFAATSCGDDDESGLQQFTVTFDSQGGSSVASQKVDEGAKVKEPTAPTKENAAFLGWFKETSCVNGWNFDKDVVTGDVTLYAGWTEVTMETLRQLVMDAEALISTNYEGASFNAMQEKLNEARAVIYNEGSTQEDILTAYQELNEAMKNLVMLPHRPTVGLKIEPLPTEDGYIFASPGNWLGIYVMGVDADGNESSQSAVTFEHSLDEWVENPETDLQEMGTMLSVAVKADVELGSTKILTVKSTENPEISRTITVKIEDLVQQFINTVMKLPAPETITMDDYEEVGSLLMQAEDLYYRCSGLPGAQGSTFEDARFKMYDCRDAIDGFMKFSYSFNGNRCKLYELVYEETMYCDYQANGAFPAGAYTSDWEDYGDGFYGQTRIVLNADGTLYSEFRGSSNPDGSNPSAWEKDGEGEYIYTGSKEQGGYITMKINYDDEVVLPEEPSAMMKVFRSRK